MKKPLNGWMRIWLALSVLWLIPWIICATVFAIAYSNSWEWPFFFGGALAAIGLPALLLALGHTLAWIIRGFRKA